MRGWRLRLGWRRCRGCFWFGVFVGRLFWGAVALGVIAWWDGVAGWCGMLAVRLFWGRFLDVEDRGGVLVAGNREN